MRVLWLRPSKGKNISVRRERIAAHLREQGYEIDIVDATGLDAFGAIKVALTGDYDVIAGNVRIGLYLGYPLSRLRRIPLLGDVSDPISDIDYLPGPLVRFFERYEWFVLKRADASVFVYRSDYEEAVHREVPNATNLPNAVDFELFSDPDAKTVSEAQEVLEGADIEPTSPIAVYIGNLAPHYEIEAILDAAHEARDWAFVFIGEGKLRSLVETAASELENVYYLGSFEYELMPGFLSHADAAFCFKDSEQPLKLKEYGAAGLPTVVQSGELEKWYSNEELLFVNPRSKDIAAQLDGLLHTSQAHGKSLQQRVKSSSWERIASGYDELFRKIVG